MLPEEGIGEFDEKKKHTRARRGPTNKGTLQRARERINSQPWQRPVPSYATATAMGERAAMILARTHQRPRGCDQLFGVDGRGVADAGKSLPAAAAMRTASFFVPVHFIHPAAAAAATIAPISCAGWWVVVGGTILCTEDDEGMGTRWPGPWIYLAKQWRRWFLTLTICIYYVRMGRGWVGGE